MIFILKNEELLWDLVHEVHVESSSETSISLAGLIMKNSTFLTLLAFDFLSGVHSRGAQVTNFISIGHFTHSRASFFILDLKKFVALSSILHCSL